MKMATTLVFWFRPKSAPDASIKEALERWYIRQLAYQTELAVEDETEVKGNIAWMTKSTTWTKMLLLWDERLGKEMVETAVQFAKTRVSEVRSAWLTTGSDLDPTHFGTDAVIPTAAGPTMLLTGLRRAIDASLDDSERIVPPRLLVFTGDQDNAAFDTALQEATACGQCTVTPGDLKNLTAVGKEVQAVVFNGDAHSFVVAADLVGRYVNTHPLACYSQMPLTTDIGLLHVIAIGPDDPTTNLEAFINKVRSRRQH